jgi:hypothetical protein
MVAALQGAVTVQSARLAILSAHAVSAISLLLILISRNTEVRSLSSHRASTRGIKDLNMGK